MQKQLIFLFAFVIWANLAFSQTVSKVTVTTTSTSDTPTQAATREQLKADVAVKNSDGWEVQTSETVIFVPPAENDLQESINKEGTTIISKEEFDSRFKK